MSGSDSDESQMLINYICSKCMLCAQIRPTNYVGGDDKC